MSLKTDNFKLYKYEDNDIGDLRFINDSMDIIDKGINPFYVATQSSTNVYKVTTGLNKTSLANGYSIKVAIPSNSTGAVSVTVDSVTVPVKKPNGNAVTNFKQNGVYSLTYYNSVFILASGGVDDVNFSASDLLTGKTANNSNGEKVNGTMPNKGAVTASLNCGGSYTIPKGYHNGSGKVTANSLSSQTSANATAGDILKNKTAWVNGSKITGSMPNLTADTTIQHESGNSTKVIKADGAFIGNNTDGVQRIGFRYNGADGYITRNTLFGYPMSALRNDLGITADKIAAGNTIAGITGTYKSSNDIWAYTPGTIDLPTERENTTIVSIPFEPSIVIAFSSTETGKHYSTANPLGGDIRWGNGSGSFFKIMSGNFAVKHIHGTSNRTCINDVTYSNGKLTINSKGSYGGSDYRYTFMIIAIK